MNKRLLSLLLALVMLVSLLPTAAFAAVGAEDVILDDSLTITDELPAAAPAADEDAPSSPAIGGGDGSASLAADDNPDWIHTTGLTASNFTASDYESRWGGYGPECVLTDDKGMEAGFPKGNNNRWLSDNDNSTLGGSHWIQIDLGQTRRVSTLKIYWVNNNFTGMTIHVSNAATPGEISSSNWTKVFEREGRIRSAIQQITFAEQDVRHIRITTTGGDDQGFNTDTNGYYDTGIYYIEAYKTAPPIDTEETGSTPDGNLAQIGTFRSNTTSVGAAAVDSNITIRASASGWPTTSEKEASTNRAGLAFDGNVATGWTSRSDDDQPWLIVNLGANRTIKGMRLTFGARNIKNFKIEGSTNAQSDDWDLLYEKNDGELISQTVLAANLSSARPVRFVRLTITDYTGSSITLKEFGIFRDEQVVTQLPETPTGNLCHNPKDGVTTSASSNSEEAASVNASNAIDGDTTSSSSRWGSAVGAVNPYVQIDLGKLRAVSFVKIFWERLNVKAYTLEGSTNGSTWTPLYTRTGTTLISTVNEELSFEPAAIRYLRLTVNDYQSTGLKGDGTESVDWNTVSLFEIEAYQDAASVDASASSILAGLSFDRYTPGDTQITYTSQNPVPADYDVAIAANLEQVVGPDGTIYTPLVDTPVELIFEVTAKDGSDRAVSPNSAVTTVTIKGAHTANEGNPKPAVIPEIMEWYSSSAQTGEEPFKLTADSRVIHRYGAEGGFDTVANELTADIQDLFGLDLAHEHNLHTYEAIAADVGPGDIVIYNVLDNGTADNRGLVNGFDNETYRMVITDHVTIYAKGEPDAEHKTGSIGAYWATRTLLQSLKLSQEATGELTLARGEMRDYPEFKVRGFIMDVGRKPMSMDMLREFTKNMAWYKLNDFHLHLNDNLIFMEDYGSYSAANNAYSAFRLESDIQQESGALPLAAKDYHYTKAEFKQFVADSAKLGITVVPEIDVPAHAKAIADAFPSIRLQGQSVNAHPTNCHLDLSDAKYDNTLRIIQNIFDEYLADGTFSGTVDFGSDEYLDTRYFSNFQRFTKDMIEHLKAKGVTPRLWGSLGNQPGVAANVADGVQMNIWAPGTSWQNFQADPTTMFNAGFDLLNVNGGTMYIVPSGSGNRGGYGDYLNLTSVYNWTPNNFGSATLPAGASQILGGCFALWQDNIDTRACGINEVDTFERFFDALPVVSVKLWGEGKELDRNLSALQVDAEIIGTAPCTNPYYEVSLAQGTVQFFNYDFSDNNDRSGNNNHLALNNATIQNGILSLSGGASYAEIGLDRLGSGNSLSFRAMKLDGGGDAQIIFEGDHAYGTFAITALPVSGNNNKWKLGFSRELYDYEFNLELPVGEWVDLTLTTNGNTTSLAASGIGSVDAVGKFVSNANSNTAFRGKTDIGHSSFQIPVARIGSKKNAFRGYVDDVVAGSSSSSSTPITDGKYDIKPADNGYTASAPSALTGAVGNEGPANFAVDSNEATYWHSNYNTDAADNPNDLTDKPEKRYIQIDLASPATLGSLRYLPRANAGDGTVTQYRVEVSANGSDWNAVAEGNWTRSSEWKSAMFHTTAENVQHIRLYGVATYGSETSKVNKYMTAAEIRVCRPIHLVNDGTGIVLLPEESYPLVDGKAEPKPTVTFDGSLLEEGRDYTLSYANNTVPSGGPVTASVTVTGKGGYAGTLTQNFQVVGDTPPVVKTDLSTATVTFAEESYPLVDGKAEPKPVVKLGETTLLEGIDYDLTYANNTKVGTATVTITGKGDYEGTKTASFQVTAAIGPKDLSDARRTSITLHQYSFVATGSPITPEPIVTYDGVTLTKDVDYTVSYAHNTTPTSDEVPATVTVTGIGNCYGSASVNFRIVDPTQVKDLSDETKTTVEFAQDSYDLVGGKATPEPIVKYEGVTLLKGVDYTVEYLNNTTGGTGVVVVRGIGLYAGPYVKTFNINGGSSGSSGGSSGGSSSGGKAPAPSGTKTTVKGDGVTTVITTAPSGAMISESTYANGAKVTADIPVEGPVTAIVTLPKGADKVTVTIPTRTEPTPGQVAVIVHPNGDEEIIKTSMPTQGGLEITLDADATIQVVDNTKPFIDVPATSWAVDAIKFVTSREIFNGTGERTFSPNSDMSRAMVCTVLANLAGENTKGGATWYEKAVAWAQRKKISDGTVPTAVITREQLAAMLYRYAGSPIVTDSVPRRFRDRDDVSDWAEAAVTWCVENDLLRGRASQDGLDLAPQATATRAEVATVFQRYVALLK